MENRTLMRPTASWPELNNGQGLLQARERALSTSTAAAEMSKTSSWPELHNAQGEDGTAPPGPGGRREGSHHGSKTASMIDRLLSGEPELDDAAPASLMLYIAVAACCLNPLLFGFTIAFTSPAQSTMEGLVKNGVGPPGDLHVMTNSQFSLYASLVNIGAVVGAFSGSVMCDRFGRKKTLVLTAVPHLLGWVGSAIYSNASLLIFLRVCIGWGVGVGSAVIPVYIGEIATTRLRGGLGAANQLSVTMGIFAVNFAGTYVFVADYKSEVFVQWRYICIFVAAIALLFGIVALLPLLPESPNWLAAKGRQEECIASLRKLRSGDPSAEARAILAEASQQATGSTSDAGSSASLGNYKRSLMVGIGLLLFQQLSGVNAVMTYTADICKDAGIADANTAAMFIMLLQVILTGTSCLLMERAGRRPLLIFGSCCTTLAHLVLSYYFLTLDVPHLWGPPWLAIVGLGVFIVGFALALGPIPWLMLGEVFPTEIRGTACALATGINWTCSFVVVLGFPFLEGLLTKKGTFLFFGLMCGFSFFFIVAMVPETKGKSVEEIVAELQPPPQTPGIPTRCVSLQPPDRRVLSAQ